MSSIFVSALILHIIFGLVGTILSYVSVLSLLKKEVVRRQFLSSSFTAWISYVLSWITGGYYYWFYYGSNVKPIIVAGEYAWAHKIVMEAKEHIFLILPVASLVLTLIAWSSIDRINSDSVFKSAVTYLAITIAAIAFLIALSGVIITGGAQK